VSGNDQDVNAQRACTVQLAVFVSSLHDEPQNQERRAVSHMSCTRIQAVRLHDRVKCAVPQRGASRGQKAD
jgi:hypothetical protein